MRFRFLFTLAGCVALAWLQPAKAEMRICHSHCESNAASNPHWQSYTPRQRAISTAVTQIISTYYDQTAQPLPVTPETVTLVVQSIQAEPFEAEFVCQQMRAQTLHQLNIHTADAKLEALHQQIQNPQISCLHS